jgi:hypothetical protein
MKVYLMSQKNSCPTSNGLKIKDKFSIRGVKAYKNTGINPCVFWYIAAYGINGYFSASATAYTGIARKGASVIDGKRNDNACFSNFRGRIIP